MTGTAMDTEGLPVVEPDPHAEPEPVAEAPEPASPPPPPAAPPADPAKAGILAELQEERRARRAEAERAARLEARFAEMQKRMDGLAKPAETAPALPPRDERPIEHFDARLAPIEQRLARQDQEREQQSQQAQQFQQLQSEVSRHERAFHADNPDYYDALQHARQQRMSDYLTLGYDEASAAQLVQQEAIRLAVINLQAGRNPAQGFYDYAKRAGWKGKAPTPEQQPRDNAGRFATLEAGAKAQGLGAAPAANPGAPEMKDWANMNDADFEAEWKKYEARAKREAG